MNVKLSDFIQKVLVAMAVSKTSEDELVRSISFDPQTLHELLYSPELDGELMRHAFDLFKLIEEIARALGVTEGSLVPEPTARKPESKGPIIIHRPTRVVDR